MRICLAAFAVVVYVQPQTVALVFVRQIHLAWRLCDCVFKFWLAVLGEEPLLFAVHFSAFRAPVTGLEDKSENHSCDDHEQTEDIDRDGCGKSHESASGADKKRPDDDVFGRADPAEFLFHISRFK